MKKSIPFTALLFSYLAGCGSSPTGVTFIPPGCEPLPPTGCVGNPNNPKVNINMVSHSVAPPNVCAKANLPIEFNVNFGAVTEEINTVGTLPKDLANTWLAQKNDTDPKQFYVTAPNTPGESYDYSVLFADGECRDPRISVE